MCSSCARAACTARLLLQRQCRQAEPNASSPFSFSLFRWVAIVGTTLALRTLALPLAVLQMKNTVKLAQAKPEIERLAARAKVAVREPRAGPLRHADARAARSRLDAWRAATAL